MPGGGGYDTYQDPDAPEYLLPGGGGYDPYQDPDAPEYYLPGGVGYIDPDEGVEDPVELAIYPDFIVSTTQATVGVEINFEDRSDGEVSSYSWDFGDGSPIADTPTALHAFSSPGTYDVTLTIADDSNGTQATKTLEIRIGGAIEADFDVSTTTPLTGQAISFANVSSGSINSYTWDFGDGSFSKEASPEKVFEKFVESLN